MSRGERRVRMNRMNDGDDDEDSRGGDGVTDLVAGSVAGAATVVIGQPLDTVKTKMQTLRGLYAGPANCLVHTYRVAGVRGLYAGTTPAVLAAVSENSVLFASYGLCQRLVAAATGASDPKQMDALHYAVAGCAASFFSSVVLCPTELVKIKLQAGHDLASVRGQRFHGTAYQVTKVGNRPQTLMAGLAIELPVLSSVKPCSIIFSSTELCSTKKKKNNNRSK